MSTLLQLRTITRYYLDDNSAQRWSDVEVNNYINQAYRNYYNRLVNVSYQSLLATPVLLNTVASTATVALPSDFYKAKILYKILSDRKQPCIYKRNYQGTIVTNLMPSNYYVPTYEFQGLNLILDPIPADSATGALELHYWPIMTVLSSDSDSPVDGFSEQWQDLLPIYAAWQAKSLREEEDVANIQAMLAFREKPFNDMIAEMSIGRVRTEVFNTMQGNDDYYVF